MAEEVTKDYEKKEDVPEGQTFSWGSEELDKATQTDDSSYFKLEKNETVKIKVDTQNKPEEKLVDFNDGSGPKRRFNIKVFLKDKKEEWTEERVWTIAPMYLHVINTYIDRTTIFEVKRIEKGFEIQALGLPAE